MRLLRRRVAVWRRLSAAPNSSAAHRIAADPTSFLRLLRASCFSSSKAPASAFGSRRGSGLLRLGRLGLRAAAAAVPVPGFGRFGRRAAAAEAALGSGLRLPAWAAAAAEAAARRRRAAARGLVGGSGLGSGFGAGGATPAPAWRRARACSGSGGSRGSPARSSPAAPRSAFPGARRMKQCRQADAGSAPSNPTCSAADSAMPPRHHVGAAALGGRRVVSGSADVRSSRERIRPAQRLAARRLSVRRRASASPFGASATSETLRNPAALTRLITSSTRP